MRADPVVVYVDFGLEEREPRGIAAQAARVSRLRDGQHLSLDEYRRLRAASRPRPAPAAWQDEDTGRVEVALGIVLVLFGIIAVVGLTAVAVRQISLLL